MPKDLKLGSGVVSIWKLTPTLGCNCKLVNIGNQRVDRFEGPGIFVNMKNSGKGRKGPNRLNIYIYRHIIVVIDQLVLACIKMHVMHDLCQLFLCTYMPCSVERPSFPILNLCVKRCECHL